MPIMMRAILDKIYKNQRKLSTGLDPRLTDLELLMFAAEKLGSRISATLRGYPTSYFARNIEIRGRRKLQLGTGVNIARHVVLDARSLNGISLGNYVTVDRSAILRASGVLRALGNGISIGDCSAIGLGSFIHGGGGVSIGRDCLLGPHVAIFSENHVYQDAKLPIRAQGEARAAVEIGNDVWVGAGTTILAGSKIGDGAVIGAGSVIRGEVASNAVVAGAPARLLKMRRGLM